MGRITSFVMGSLVGACAALAFAPRTGAEARAAVADKAVEVKDNVMGMRGQSAQQVYQDVKASASAFAADAAAKSQEVAGKVQGAVSNNANADELREKIEAARARITEQMMANMDESREAVEAVEEAAEDVEAVEIEIDDLVVEEVEEAQE